MRSDDQQYFSTVDFIVFGVSLLASISVGIYFAVKDRNRDAANYFFGGKNMSPIAVGISIAVSYVSALTIIGGPTETYLYGTVAIWFAFVFVAGTAMAVFYYVPLLHRLQVKTVFQYLEMRFSASFRKMMSTMELLSSLIYMCFALLLPALAINAVTPITLHWSILLTSAVCTVYTTLGGLKAVVWTDVIQFGFMLFGSTAALIMATVEVGGLEKVWSALDRGGRLNFFEFDPDPTLRNTFWTMVVGGSVNELMTLCMKQTVVQRYLACRTVRDAQKAAVTAFFPNFILVAVSFTSGAVAYAYFEGCDPLASGAVAKSDQMFPYLVLKVFRNLPGMAGLFIAATFSGTLSTVSSGLNSMTAQLLEDFLLPYLPNLNAKSKSVFSKLTVFTIGVLITGLTYLLLLLDGTVFSLITSVKGGLIGASVGVYTLGIFLPWCNTKGAVAGEIAGFIVATWLGIGGIVYGKSPESQRKLPVSTQCCNVTEAACSAGNFSTDFSNLTDFAAGNSTTSVQLEYNPIYAVSFWYLPVIGFFVTVSVGLLVSFITGVNEPSKSDPKLFSPIMDNGCLPENVRRFFRFGVPDLKECRIRNVWEDKAHSDENEMIITMEMDSRKGVRSCNEQCASKMLDD